MLCDAAIYGQITINGACLFINGSYYTNYCPLEYLIYLRSFTCFQLVWKQNDIFTIDLVWPQNLSFCLSVSSSFKGTHILIKIKHLEDPWSKKYCSARLRTETARTQWKHSRSAYVVVEAYGNIHDRHLTAIALTCSKFT